MAAEPNYAQAQDVNRAKRDSVRMFNRPMRCICSITGEFVEIAGYLKMSESKNEVRNSQKPSTFIPVEQITPGLYADVLGPSFSKLAPVLRQFHSGREMRQAKGVVMVRRGPSRLGRALAALLQMPQESDQTTVALQLEPAGPVEIWKRTFDGQPATSRQWREGGFIIEHAGPLKFQFKLRVVDSALHFHSRRVWLFGFPLPSFLRPTIVASESARDRGWATDVVISMFKIITVLQYRGEVHQP